MRGVEENAIETAKEMTDSELRKREQQYDVLKKHVDFSTKVGGSGGSVLLLLLLRTTFTT
jgi:hypothetical protein